MHADAAPLGGPPCGIAHDRFPVPRRNAVDSSASFPSLARACVPAAFTGVAGGLRAATCEPPCGGMRRCRTDQEVSMELSSAAAVRPSLSSLSSPAGGTVPSDEPPRAKFLCSFGGRILPRPLDGKLRYVGGETRIVCVPRDVTYGELMARMRELFEGAWYLKYQQPEEDLDALVSVVNDDDLAIMMEEHDKLAAGGNGFTRLRVFLFSHPDHDGGAGSPSVRGVCFDSSDELETEKMYVDALNSPMDVNPQFPGDVLSGVPIDGGSVHGAGDKFFGHGGIDAGLHDLFKLHHLHMTPQSSHGQRYSEMEGPRSPGYCSPGHRTPHGPQEFPPSPSSGGYHPGFAETNGRFPDEYVRQSSPHQGIQYEHHPVFVDDGACLSPGCTAGEKAGFPGNLGYTYNFYEPESGCKHCRMALQRNKAAVPEDRIFDCWVQGQPQLDQFNASSGFFGQVPNSSCAECFRSREAYLLPHDIRLDHSAYLKEQNEHTLFCNEVKTHESGWALNHHQMNHSVDEPRVRQNELFMADSNGTNFHFAHGIFYGRHAVTPSHISHEDPCYVRSAAVQGNGEYNGHQLAAGGTHIQVEDKRTQYLKSPVYGSDGIYQVGSSSTSSSRRKMQGVCSIASNEVPSLVMQTHGTVNMGYTRTTSDDSPRFSHNGIDAQIPSSWAVQSGNSSQKMFPTDGHLTIEHYYDHASKPCQGHRDTFTSESVPCQLGKGNYNPPSGAVNVATPSAFLVGDKSSACPPPVYRSNPAAVADVTPPVVNEISVTGGEYGTSDAKVVNVFDIDKVTSRDEQDSDCDPKESRSLVRGGNSSKFCRSDACGPCERQELPDECLSFLPEFIASVKKVTLEDIEMVKSKAEANAAENASPDQGMNRSSLHGSAPVATSAAEDVDSDIEHKTISKIEPTMAEAEALAKGLQTIKNDDLEEIRELGSGTYGSVYHGKWKGSDVAIKRIKASCFAGRPSERERLIADFWREALIMSSLHHPNIVAFYGIVRDGPDGSLATVTEFMVNGSLKQFLQKKDRTIDRRKRLIIAMDVAFGMEYLHGKNIVHFDLKCENLLVNMRDPHRPVCKIGDLGLSKVKQKTLVSGGVRGTLPWMAPELLSGKSNMVTEKIDVYSFGIVMWELLTGEEPYSDMHCASIIGGIVNNTLRPQIPGWCDPEWKSLMESCWSSDPGDRPSFSEISQGLRKMAAAINVK